MLTSFLLLHRNDAKASVHGYSGQVYKSFNSRSEAEAFASGSGGYGASKSSSSSSSSGGSYGGSSYSGGSYGGSSYSGGSYGGGSYGGSYGGGSTPKVFHSAVAVAGENTHTQIYTDGSSRGNGQNGARAGYGVYYGDNDKRNVSAPLTDGPQTNQRAELAAITHALRNASTSSDKKVHIHTDSQYALKALNEWGDNWDRNGYRTAQGQPVVNKDLVKEGRQLMREIKSQGGEVKMSHVKGHSTTYANNMADKLAVAGAEKNT